MPHTTVPLRDSEKQPLYPVIAVASGARIPGAASFTATSGSPLGSYAKDGVRHLHAGDYNIVFEKPDMRWIAVCDGKFPQGGRLLEGGHDSEGRPLFHAAARIKGLRIPGMVAPHLIGARVVFEDTGYIVEDYELLCWVH